jgi:hypothetical protein
MISRFVRSSLCRTDQPMCVEVSGLDRDVVIVRDSKTGEILAFTRAEWDAFLRGVRAGEFDLRDAAQMAQP